MPWLKVDDTFDTHPKILALKTDERRWTWQRILIYTCRHRTAVIPKTIKDAIPKATPALIRDCVELGLIDVAKDGTMRVHDWRIYNSQTIAEKISAYMERYPQATANEVYKAIGGKREVVLEVYGQLTAGGSQVVPPLVPEKFPSGSENDDPLVPLARARGPVPGSKDNPPNPNPVVDDARDPQPDIDQDEVLAVVHGHREILKDFSSW